MGDSNAVLHQQPEWFRAVAHSHPDISVGELRRNYVAWCRFRDTKRHPSQPAGATTTKAALGRLLEEFHRCLNRSHKVDIRVYQVCLRAAIGAFVALVWHIIRSWFGG